MAKARDANWIDGLRGVASFMVVGGHLCTAFAPWLHAPSMSEKENPTLFQLPFLRLCVGGRSAVALFFLITGYVNSIGPIAKARAGNHDAAFSSIARSSLARAGRLILPTMIATFFSWFLANVNAYHMTKHVDATWIRQGWHRQEPSLWAAIKSLFHAEVLTWTRGWDEYDGTQWTLILFLEASMMVYLTMLTTILVTPRARKCIFVMLYFYAWLAGIGPLKSMNVAVGMMVAELHNEYGSGATDLLPAPVPAIMILCGMFMAGYPQDAPDRILWSRTMKRFMKPIIPKDSDLRRYWDSLGASTVLLGIFFSKNARAVLSSPVFNFLGRVSFPVYLLHNQLIKSVLTWMVYLPSALNPPRNEKGEQMDLRRGSMTHLLLAIAVFYYLLYRLALMWTVYVDPLCAKIVKLLTNWAYGEGQSSHQQAEKPKAVLPA